MVDPKDYDKEALAETERKELVNGLVGLYIHIMDHTKTCWQYQGRIVGREGDCFLIQMFDAFMGERGDILLYNLADLAREPGHVRLYREWREAGDDMMRRRKDAGNARG